MKRTKERESEERERELRERDRIGNIWLRETEKERDRKTQKFVAKRKYK